MSVLLLSLCAGLVSAQYPFTTSSGGPTCQVQNCATCKTGLVEYAPTQSRTDATFIPTTASFWEQDLSGKCCGNNCGAQNHGDLYSGYGECWDGGTWKLCGLCENAKCLCRRLSNEILPTKCQTCNTGYYIDTKGCTKCPTGYTSDGVSCYPINHCQDKTATCGAFTTCTYTGAGTYTCPCVKGYSAQGNACTEINNCLAGPSVSQCSGNATCTKTGPGTNTCACKSGYTGDGTLCRNINECVEGGNNCDLTRQYCVDTPGSFLCFDCDTRCDNGCKGPNRTQCNACAAFQDVDTCVRSCPAGKYADASRFCQPCNAECVGGCSGGSPSDCAGCEHYQIIINSTTPANSSGSGSGSGSGGGSGGDGNANTNLVVLCVNDCVDDYWSDSGRFCHRCSTGPCGELGGIWRYESIGCSPTADRVCTECPIGYKCAEGSDEAVVCPPGSTQPNAGRNECQLCSPGYFCLGGSHREMCENGYVAPVAGASNCSKCPEGTTSGPASMFCYDLDKCADAKSICSPWAGCIVVNGSAACKCLPPFVGNGLVCDLPTTNGSKTSTTTIINQGDTASSSVANAHPTVDSRSGTIIGLAVAFALVCFCLLCLLICWCCRRCLRKRRQGPEGAGVPAYDHNNVGMANLPMANTLETDYPAEGVPQEGEAGRLVSPVVWRGRTNSFGEPQFDPVPSSDDNKNNRGSGVKMHLQS